MPNRILGIDPGNNGGMVLLAKARRGWGIERVFKLARGEDAITRFMTAIGGNEPNAPTMTAYLEQVHGWGEGRSFNFGMYYGFVRGCLKSSGMTELDGTLVNVTPQKWMPAMGVPPKKGEGAMHRMAMRDLAEGIQDEVTSTNWNAAAILIAFYGLKQVGGVYARHEAESVSETEAEN